jgi:hypothetical protein
MGITDRVRAFDGKAKVVYLLISLQYIISFIKMFLNNLKIIFYLKRLRNYKRLH